MMMSLLSKITKMAWTDHTEFQQVVQHLMQLQSMSEQHVLISLTAINDLILEMSYVYKIKNYTHKKPQQ